MTPRSGIWGSSALPLHNDISYLRRVVERPLEVGVIGKGFLDTLYGRRYVGLSQRDDFN
jgi:hypothetical protein